MKELESLFLFVGGATLLILIAYKLMARKAKPKKSKGWSEPKVK